VKLGLWLWVVVLIGVFSPLASACQTPIDLAVIVHGATGDPAWSHNPWFSSTSKSLTDDTIADRFNVDRFNNGIFSFDFVNTDGLRFIKLSCIHSGCRFERYDSHSGFKPKFDVGGGGWRFTPDVDESVPSATPEPGTWILFATGIFSFALIRFGRKRSVVTPLA
jgi:hypothetical protein